MDIKNKAYNAIDKLTGRKTFTESEKSRFKDFFSVIGKDVRNQSAGRKQAIDKILEDTVDRVKQDIENWRLAIEQAEDFYDPDPFELYQLYIDVLDDDQVFSTMQQRISKAIGGRIAIKDENNEINEELTAVMIKPDGTPLPWFREFLRICMMSKFYGYSIAQFRPPVDRKFVVDLKTGDMPVENIPFVNMIPRFRAIRKDINMSVQDKENRIPVYGGPGSNWLIQCGYDKDLGLLNKIAPFYIWKKVFGSWSQHAAIFGMPFRKGNTDIRDNERFQNMINMFEDMTGATYFIGHENDEVEISYPPGGSGSGSDIYKNLIEKCDQAIAKIVLSQTGTTDEKSFAGSAGVHESVMEGVTWSDKLDLAGIIDEKLIPFLKRIGLMPEGANVFCSWEIEDGISLTEWADIIQKLAGVFDMEPDEIGKKFNLSLDAKEVQAIPGVQETDEQKQNRKELQNAYQKLFR